MRKDISPLKILMTSHIADLKGSAMSFWTLITGLDRNKFEVLPLFTKPGPLISKLQERGFTPQTLTYQGWEKLLAVGRAKKIIRENNIGLVYVNCAVGFSRIVAMAAYDLNIPVIWHIREPPESSRVKKNKKWIKKTASQVVAVSEELKQTFSHLAPTVKIDNGVDLERFHKQLDGAAFRRTQGLRDDDFVFGIVGSIEARKNSKMFVEAAIELTKHNINLRFIIAGSGKKDYVQSIKQMVSEAAMEKHFTFTGSLWDVPALMASLNVLVMPSQWEGFPRVIVESMAVGTPAIAADVGDVSYILDNDINGCIMATLSLQELLDKMQYAIDYPGKFRAMGEAAAKKAHERFSQQRHVSLMQNLFDATASSAE